MANVAAASGPQVRVLSVVAIGHAVKFLLSSTFLLAGVPALLYTGARAWQKRPSDPGQTLLLSIIVVCLGWFIFRSIGWPRYAYPIVALSNILTAKLFIDLGGLVNRPAIFTARGAAALLLVLALPMGHLKGMAAELFARPDHSVQDLRRWMDATVAAGSRIETWEFEVAFMDTARHYHFPPVRFVDKMIARVNLGVAEDLPYDFLQYQPQYVIIGRFAKWTSLYPENFLAQRTAKVATFGEYDVYEVTPKNAER